MSKTKFASRIYLDSLHLKGSAKTSANLSTTLERLCSTCENYDTKKLECLHIGKIKKPNTVIHCSWWEEKFKKEVKTKRCSKCGELKLIDKFYKDKSSDDGHQYKCSKCAIEYSKEWQRNDKKVKEIMGG